MDKLISMGTQDIITYAYGPHKHDFWEITYYIEGEGTNITNGISFPFREGTIICQPPNVIHEDISNNGYKNIFFEVDSLFDFQTPLVLRDNDSKSFLKVIELMYQEYFETNDPAVITSFLIILNSFILRLSTPRARDPHIEKMKKEIFFNYSSAKFHVSDSFINMPWSESQIRRNFKQETGMTPQKYLESIRIRQAKKMLLYDTYSITQISLMCGFDDAYYFSKFFKKNTGMSPSEYRSKRRGKNKKE